MGPEHANSVKSGTCPQHALFGTGIESYPYVDKVQWGEAGKRIVDLFGETNDTLSEDCLTLNIWTPKDMSGPPKPIMFWVYGGGKQHLATCRSSRRSNGICRLLLGRLSERRFVHLSSQVRGIITDESPSAYFGGFLAEEQDVILVSVNYRKTPTLSCL